MDVESTGQGPVAAPKGRPGPGLSGRALALALAACLAGQGAQAGAKEAAVQGPVGAAGAQTGQAGPSDGAAALPDERGTAPRAVKGAAPAGAAGREGAAPALRGEVTLAGVVILRFAEPVQGLAPDRRASVVANRLLDILERYRASLDQLPDLVRVRLVGGEVGIFVGDALLVTVDEVHARLNGSTRLKLAGVWADNLRRALREFARIQADVPLPGS